MAVQVKPDQAYAYAELLEILDSMEEEYIVKLPKKLISIFKKYALEDYEKHIDVTRPLEEQEISPKTAALIGMLTLQYWCKSEQEKQELINIFKENERKHEETLREKYNPDNIFNNNSTVNEEIVDNIDEKLGEIDELDKISEEESRKAALREKERALIAESRAQFENSRNQSAGALVDYNNFSWYKKAFIKIKTTIYNIFKNFKKAA